MAAPISREEFETPAGRARAWRSFLVSDHALVRKLFDNSHEVSPGKVWRSYQPSPADLKRWKARGIRTVVNLRGDKPSSFYFLEEDACRRLGLKLVTFRVFSREAPSKDVLTGARTLFETIDYPALFHCKSGADRVGLMSALYLFLHEGVPLDEAAKQLSLRYGHIRQGKTGVIDAALERYIAHCKAEGVDLADRAAFFRWVEADYDPQAVKREFLATWWGALLTERILRRE